MKKNSRIKNKTKSDDEKRLLSVATTATYELRDIMPPGKGLARSQAEATEYIVEMLVVLCNMAKDVDLRFLTYLLEMAYEESTNHVDKTRAVAKSTSRQRSLKSI